METNKTAEKTKIPLVVDLDGTLLKTELPWEAFLSVFLKHPIQLLKIFVRKIKIQTPAYFKTETQKWADLCLEGLPFSPKFLSWLKEQKHLGRTLILCTGSTQSYASAIQKQTNLFDSAYGSTLGTNLVGSKKALFLAGKFGKGQFDYAGNALADLKVAPYARCFILVNPSFLAKLFSKKIPIHLCFREKDIEPSHLSSTLAFPLWFLNCIIFVAPPLFASANSAGPLFPSLALSAVHFNFSALAFSVLFHLFSIEKERRQAGDKSTNLFATGELGIPFGFFLFILFFVLAFVSLLALKITAVLPSLLYVYCVYLLMHGRIKNWLIPVPIRYVFCALPVLLQGFFIVLF